MRDEMDGRLWTENHEQFSQGIDDLVAKLRGAVGRVPAWDGTTAQLLALIVAFALTALTFNTTSA
jgi:hypothetical protein